MGVDARGFPGGLLRLDPAFAYVEPPSSWPLPWAECLMPAPNRNGVVIIVNKRVWNAVLGCNLKNDRTISVHFQGKPFSITVIQVYALTSMLRSWSWSWTVLWSPTRRSRTNTPKRCPFHYRGLGCQSRKSRNTWNNRKIWPWSTGWSRAKASRVLPRDTVYIKVHLWCCIF